MKNEKSTKKKQSSKTPKTMALVSLYENLSQLRSKIYDEIIDSADNLTDGVYDGLNYIANGEMTAEEFWKKNAGFFKRKKKETVEFGAPVININPGALSVTVSKKVDGGSLVACSCESDPGTYQVLLSYEDLNGIMTNISVAEVKRDELAYYDGKPLDNKDVDVYVWKKAERDTDDEDYTERFTLDYDDLYHIKDEDV